MPTPRSPRLTRGRQGARVLLALCAAALVVAAVAGQAPVPPARVSQDDQAYMCPMHPDVVADTAGTCPRCRMQLVLGRPYDMRNYRVELRTTPAIVRPGEKTRLEIGVFHPGTGERILAFTEVHQKRFHLFVISQDMTFFEHVHPLLHGRKWNAKCAVFRLIPAGAHAQDQPAAAERVHGRRHSREH